MPFHLRIALYLAFLCPLILATTPVPYQWGKYKPIIANNKTQVILVDWFSEEGKRRLNRSHHKNDFYQLAHLYQPQINPVYAGIATSVIFLNAFRLPKHSAPSQPELEIQQPKALGGELIPFPAYSQLTFLNDDTDKIKDRKLIGLKNITKENENDKSQFKPGTGLDDLKGLLGVYGIEVEITYAKEPPKDGIKTFRNTLKRVLNDSDHFLMANFKGDALGASTGGTVSPLAAYDEKSDSVLILDVTGHKNPWYWAPTDALYRSMNTQYSGIWRGYAVVSERAK